MRTLRQYREQQSPVDTDAYQVALERIKSAVYALHPISDVSTEDFYRARNDVAVHIEQLQRVPLRIAR